EAPQARHTSYKAILSREPGSSTIGISRVRIGGQTGASMFRWTWLKDDFGRARLRLTTKRLLMYVLRRRLVLLASVFLSVISLLASSDRVFGQTGGFTPSADQIEMFKNLSPDQQQSIMQSLGGSSGGLGA